MSALNLQIHTPDEFAGKTVAINGCNYRMGPSFRNSDQGFAHYLTNELSSLCLHIIQIHMDYMSAPESAKAASKAKERANALLRSDLQKQSKSVEIPIISAIEANGSCFELHEISWGAFDSPEEPPRHALIDKVIAYMKANDFSSARTELNNFLAEFPNHSEALNNLALCYANLGEFPAAVDIMNQAIRIEPNYAEYLGNRVMYGLNSPRRRQALDFFRQLKAKYPLLTDYDFYGVHAYLCCGEPNEARALLKSTALPKQQADELSIQVSAAIAAQKQFQSLEKNFRNGQPLTASTLVNLEKIYATYGSDPMIQANLGFALYGDGQYKRAQQLLMMAAGGLPEKWVIYCWANSAFCGIELGDWAPAMQQLHVSKLVLNSMGPKMNYCDAPGIVTWIFDDMVKESISPSASEVVDKALTSCPDQSLITDEVRELADLYREAAEKYSNHGPANATGAQQNVNNNKSKNWWQRFWKR